MIDESALRGMGDEAVGTIGTLLWSPTLQTPANQTFMKLAEGKLGRTPAYFHAIMYSSGRWITEAANALNGQVEDREKLVAAIRRAIETTPDPRGPIKLDQWVAMTLAAAATSRVRLATCVTNLVTRHPSITASAAASVDLAAGGRTILGIGAGHSGVANVGGAPTRAAELGEGLAFLKTALSGAPASWRGAATHLPWVKRPVPVYAAASGPAALRATGAVADGAFVNYGLRPAEVARVRGLIVEGAVAAGRPASAVDVWSIACLDVAERRADALA